MAVQWKPQKLLDLTRAPKKEVEGKYAEGGTTLPGKNFKHAVLEVCALAKMPLNEETMTVEFLRD
jgi:hypothetical protein